MSPGSHVSYPPSFRQRRPGLRKVIRAILLLLVLGLVLHLLLPQLNTFRQSWIVIQAMPQWLVILAAAAQVLSLTGSALLLRLGVAVVGQRLSLISGLIIALASSSIGLLAGGMMTSIAGTFRWLRHNGVSAAGAGLAGMLPFLFGNLVLTVLAIFGLGHLFVRHDLTRWQSVIFGLVLLILAAALGLALWGERNRPILTHYAHRLSQRWSRRRRRPFDPTRLDASIEQAYHIWDQLRGGGWRGPLFGALFSSFFNLLALFILFRAAGFPIDFGVLLAGYGFPLLLGKVSLIPGGLGVIEGAMTAIYTTLAVPTHITVVVILAFRALTFWLPTLIGFLAFFYLQHRVQTRRPADQASDEAAGVSAAHNNAAPL